MTLLQILAELQTEPAEALQGRENAIPIRGVVLAVEEPELYMHPQMERKMRDALYRLADQPGFQIICTTQLPFLWTFPNRRRQSSELSKTRIDALDFSKLLRICFLELTQELKKRTTSTHCEIQSNH